MVKAAEKRKDIQVMISEANAIKRKSEEQAGEISVLQSALSPLAEIRCKLWSWLTLFHEALLF